MQFLQRQPSRKTSKTIQFFVTSLRSATNILTSMKFRCSHQRCSIKKGLLINFTKFSGKYLCQSPLLKKRLWHRCFPVNFVKFLRTPFLQNTSGRLLLGLYFQMKLSNISFYLCRVCTSGKIVWKLSSVLKSVESLDIVLNFNFFRSDV